MSPEQNDTVRRWTPCIKLTDAMGRTHNGTPWGRGITSPAGVLSGQGGLCSGGFYHAYDATPALALFLNPLHADFHEPQVWLAAYRGRVERDGALKFGATELRTVRRLTVPEPTTVQRVAFAIFCAEYALEAANYAIPAWQEWAALYLSGDAWAARAAESAANAAAWAAERAAAWAASAAERAARAAESAAASAAERAAAWAASAAERAARAAAWAAASAAERAAASNLLENPAAWAMSRDWRADR